MVKENLDLNKRILDFELNKFKQNQQHQQQQQQQQHLTNVVNDIKNRQDNLSTPLKPPDTETDRLSWNFFEEISDLDNQLRTNVTNNLHYTPAKLICNNQIDEDFQQSKTNGYVSSADIFSQPDVILKHQQFEEQNQQQQQQNQPTFQFTSPTSTFKRKKLLQVQREQHQSEHKSQHLYNNKNSTNNNNNNNNNSVAEEEDSEAGTIYHNSLSPILNFNTVTVFTSKNHKTISCNSNSNSNSNSNNKSGNSNKEQSLTLKRNHIQSHNEPLEVASTLISTGSGVIVDKGNTLTTATLPNRTKRTDNTTNGRKLNATIGRLPDNGSTITSDDTKPVSGNQGTTRRLNSRRTMGTEGGSSQSSKMATGSGYMEKMETHLSLYGWRKKCLYAILVVLMLLITINLMLTFWILQVMEFSTEGMGLLKIIPGGVQLTGQTLIMDLLRASTIRSRHGQPIAIESSRNFSINTRDRNGVLENHLYLGHDKLECLATGFRINDTAGRNLFSVNRNEVTIGAHALKIDGEGGAVFRESVQTPHIRAEPGRELRLESPTRQLEITAAKDINLQSRAGGIDLSALEDIKLSALDGSLRLESSKILMPNLRTAQTPLPGATQNREHVHRVFQLCACANGKLFLAAPHSICAGDDSTVCR